MNDSELSSPDARGTIVGRYALVGEIASGGMATVYYGRLLGPAGFSKTVAIKRLHPQYARDPEFVAMLLDEARLATRIQHLNVVATLDVVALKGELLVVLEYVHGESLARLLRRARGEGRRVPFRVAAALVGGVLHGLHAAHEATNESDEPLGIVHRDVSPQNVLVGVDGVARVLDFGIAKATGRMQQTREGQLKGKLPYMSPEHAQGDGVDRRSDVYSASILLWEMLTGERLFTGDNEWALLSAVARGAQRRPSEIVHDLPPGLDEIVMRGLSPNPADRFATARDMAVALEDAVGLASPRQVGEWVAEIAGDLLAKRSAQLKEIELLSSRDLGRDAPSPSTIRAHLPSIQTETTHDGPGDGGAPGPAGHEATSDRAADPGFVPAPPPVSREVEAFLEPRFGVTKGRALAFVVAVLVLVGVGVTSRWGARATPTASSQHTDAATAGPEPTSASPSPPSTSPSAAGSAPAAAPSSTATVAASSAPAAKSEAAHASSPNPHAGLDTRGKAAPVAQKPPPKAGASCETPYFVDEAGIRRIKPECL